MTTSNGERATARPSPRDGADDRGRGANRESVRRRNLATLLGHVHRAGQLSRAALTSSTGLNRSTVGALVSDLAARGLLEEGDAVGSGSPGRPSPLVRPLEGGLVALAADVEVASIAFAVAGLGGRLLAVERMDRPLDRRTPDATVEDLARLADRAVGELAATTRVAGFGVGVAGLVRAEDGFVHLAPNLAWRDVPLGDALAIRLRGGVRVAVGNEADLGARAEHVRGAGVGVDDLIYVSGEVGVGGGVIVHGRPLSGAAGYAGEVGHLVVNPDGHPCRCGSRGCWETEVGEVALLRRLRRTAAHEREGVDAVLREAAAGSAPVLDALAETGRWLGIGLAGLVNVFNPDRIVLGGFFARAHPYVADALRRELERVALAPARANLSVVPASLGEDSTLLGAVELALAPVLADPAAFAPLPVDPADPDEFVQGSVASAS